jgi:hypothetical protein
MIVTYTLIEIPDRPSRRIINPPKLVTNIKHAIKAEKYGTILPNSSKVAYTGVYRIVVIIKESKREIIEFITERPLLNDIFSTIFFFSL